MVKRRKSTFKEVEIKDLGEYEQITFPKRTITVKKRQKNWSKLARDKGYRAERDSVLLLRTMGCWAKRLRSRDQVGEMRPVDGYYWDPIRKAFGFFQTKYQKKYFGREERERLLLLCAKYNVECILFWRDRGMRFEILRYIK